MITIVETIKGKKALVVGLARSGVGAANLLSRLGAKVTVTDRKGPEELRLFLDRLNPDITIKLREYPTELLDTVDLIVVSPGVPLHIASLRLASRKGIKIIGELELAYQYLKHLQRQSEFLAITGTNGKSTTSTLLYEMLKNNGFNAFLGGNIGNALTEEMNKVIGEVANSGKGNIPCYIVTEVSSFQLESIDKFKPKGATILNITPDHLDRYSSMSDYVDAKCRIFLNQDTKDFLVLNADDPMVEGIAGKIKKGGPEVFYFSRKKEVKGAYFKAKAEEGTICLNLPDLSLNLNLSLKIRGVHNIENAMAASIMAVLSGCGVDTIVNTLENFKGLEHRLEYVDELDGITFINDSKGTNVGAVMKSLESFHEPVILIAGGIDKGGDFSVLRTMMKDRVKAVILIGEAKDKMKDAFEDVTEVILADELMDALCKSKNIASPGDVVLLSPACASFDMFKDYEDRGRAFKKAVSELKKLKTEDCRL